jgi:hypothetical protein
MFALIIMPDLLVCDVTVHNLRHPLRRGVRC